MLYCVLTSYNKHLCYYDIYVYHMIRSFGIDMHHNDKAILVCLM